MLRLCAEKTAAGGGGWARDPPELSGDPAWRPHGPGTGPPAALSAPNPPDTANVPLLPAGPSAASGQPILSGLTLASCNVDLFCHVLFWEIQEVGVGTDGHTSLLQAMGHPPSGFSQTRGSPRLK